MGSSRGALIRLCCCSARLFALASWPAVEGLRLGKLGRAAPPQSYLPSPRSTAPSSSADQRSSQCCFIPQSRSPYMRAILERANGATIPASSTDEDFTEVLTAGEQQACATEPHETFPDLQNIIDELQQQHEHQLPDWGATWPRIAGASDSASSAATPTGGTAVAAAADRPPSSTAGSTSCPSTLFLGPQNAVSLSVPMSRSSTSSSPRRASTPHPSAGRGSCEGATTLTTGVCAGASAPGVVAPAASASVNRTSPRTTLQSAAARVLAQTRTVNNLVGGGKTTGASSRGYFRAKMNSGASSSASRGCSTSGTSSTSHMDNMQQVRPPPPPAHQQHPEQCYTADLPAPPTSRDIISAARCPAVQYHTLVPQPPSARGGSSSLLGRPQHATSANGNGYEEVDGSATYRHGDARAPGLGRTLLEAANPQDGGEHHEERPFFAPRPAQISPLHLSPHRHINHSEDQEGGRGSSTTMPLVVSPGEAHTHEDTVNGATVSATTSSPPVAMRIPRILILTEDEQQDPASPRSFSRSARQWPRAGYSTEMNAGHPPTTHSGAAASCSSYGGAASSAASRAAAAVVLGAASSSSTATPRPDAQKTSPDPFEAVPARSSQSVAVSTGYTDCGAGAPHPHEGHRQRSGSLLSPGRVVPPKHDAPPEDLQGTARLRVEETAPSLLPEVVVFPPEVNAFYSIAKKRLVAQEQLEAKRQLAASRTARNLDAGASSGAPSADNSPRLPVPDAPRGVASSQQPRAVRLHDSSTITTPVDVQIRAPAILHRDDDAEYGSAAMALPPARRAARDQQQCVWSSRARGQEESLETADVKIRHDESISISHAEHQKTGSMDCLAIAQEAEEPLSPGVASSLSPARVRSPPIGHLDATWLMTTLQDVENGIPIVPEADILRQAESQLLNRRRRRTSLEQAGGRLS
ncbi:unnamed protein product [Amoebophrya sp. A120]|nr:unnamed protein product [Amoebophrya sp. A120]|eukprot:GSA120T00010560001.1